MENDLSKLTRVRESYDFPTTILLDSFNGCNLRCSMCDHKNMKRPIQLMDWELYSKLIKEIAKEKPDARVWLIFFGDPFLIKDLDERIRYAKDHNLTDVVLNTNGVLMTKDKAEKALAAGLDAIYVGIDAATEETYNKIRVGGNFQKAVDNVLEYKRLMNQSTTNQKLFVQFVESEVNQHEVDEFREFWKSKGVTVKLRPKVSWAGLVEANNLKPVERRLPCYWLMQTINICSSGSVALCSCDPHCRVHCGNARTHTIKQLWFGKLKRYRTMQKKGRWDELPTMCKNCLDWESAYAEYAV